MALYKLAADCVHEINDEKHWRNGFIQKNVKMWLLDVVGKHSRDKWLPYFWLANEETLEKMRNDKEKQLTLEYLISKIVYRGEDIPSEVCRIAMKDTIKKGVSRGVIDCLLDAKEPSGRHMRMLTKKEFQDAVKIAASEYFKSTRWLKNVKAINGSVLHTILKFAEENTKQEIMQDNKEYIQDEITMMLMGRFSYPQSFCSSIKYYSSNLDFLSPRYYPPLLEILTQLADAKTLYEAVSNAINRSINIGKIPSPVLLSKVLNEPQDEIVRMYPKQFEKALEKLESVISGTGELPEEYQLVKKVLSNIN